MKSPFEDLQIDQALVCEFFATFMRFEYAMKATEYCRGDHYGNALPDWEKIKSDLGSQISDMQDEVACEEIAYLVNEPPQIQRFVDGHPWFTEVPLNGQTLGAKALEAAKRVRNNLFHGGKHTQYSPPERDTKLIRAALAVLSTCLNLHDELRAEFEHQLI